MVEAFLPFKCHLGCRNSCPFCAGGLQPRDKHKFSQIDKTNNGFEGGVATQFQFWRPIIQDIANLDEMDLAVVTLASCDWNLEHAIEAHLGGNPPVHRGTAARGEGVR